MWRALEWHTCDAGPLEIEPMEVWQSCPAGIYAAHQAQAAHVDYQEGRGHSRALGVTEGNVV